MHPDYQWEFKILVENLPLTDRSYPVIPNSIRFGGIFRRGDVNWIIQKRWSQNSLARFRWWNECLWSFVDKIHCLLTYKINRIRSKWTRHTVGWGLEMPWLVFHFRSSHSCKVTQKFLGTIFAWSWCGMNSRISIDKHWSILVVPRLYWNFSVQCPCWHNKQEASYVGRHTQCTR